MIVASARYYLGSGGAPLPLQIKQKFEALSGCILVEGYGLTEAGPVCTVNPFTGVNKPGSVGMPLPGTLIEITDQEDPERVLPNGERLAFWAPQPVPALDPPDEIGNGDPVSDNVLIGTGAIILLVAVQGLIDVGGLRSDQKLLLNGAGGGVERPVCICIHSHAPVADVSQAIPAIRMMLVKENPPTEVG